MNNRYFLAGTKMSIAHWIQNENVHVIAEDVHESGDCNIVCTITAARMHEAYEEITYSQAKQIIDHENYRHQKTPSGCGL